MKKFLLVSVVLIASGALFFAKPPALPNAGNSCYMNSMLQCLNNIIPLKNFVVSDTFQPTTQFMSEYQKLMRAVATHKDSINDLSLTSFYASVGARMKYERIFSAIKDWFKKETEIQSSFLQGYINSLRDNQSEDLKEVLLKWVQVISNNENKKTYTEFDVQASFISSLSQICDQQDSSELFRIFFDFAEKAIPIFKDLFGIMAIEGIWCKNMPAQGKSPQYFSSIDLNISESYGKNKVLELPSLLSATENVPEGANVPQGMKPEDCRKQTKYTKFSEYVVIAVGRFYSNPVNEIQEKVNTPIEVPFEFDMRDFICSDVKIKDEEYIYELISFSSHSGNIGGGHWIAYIKDQSEQKPSWYYCSDSTITSQSIQEAQNASAAASVYFYKRMSAQDAKKFLAEQDVLRAEQDLKNLGNALASLAT